MEEQKALISQAIDIVGLATLAANIGVSQQRLFNWKKRGLPRTEWTGETDFSGAIQRATKGKVKKTALLQKAAA